MKKRNPITRFLFPKSWKTRYLICPKENENGFYKRISTNIEDSIREGFQD